MATLEQLKIERDKLFSTYREKYVLKDNEEIIIALTKAGIKDFKLVDMPKYEEALTQHLDAREKKLLELYECGVQANPCPIIGCHGYKKYDSYGLRWDCSTGGAAHYIAMRMCELRAAITGNTDNIREDATKSLGLEVTSNDKEN